MLRELLWWLMFCKHFPEVLSNVEGILVGFRWILSCVWGLPSLHTWGCSAPVGNSSVFLHPVSQGQAGVCEAGEDLWTRKKGAVCLWVGAAAWCSLETKQNVEFSARFGSSPFIYWRECSDALPRNLLMWVHVCILVHLDGHIYLPVLMCLCVQGLFVLK